MLRGLHESQMAAAANVSLWAGVHTIVMPEPVRRFVESQMAPDAFGEYDRITWCSGEHCYVLGFGRYVQLSLPPFVVQFEKF
jgi:hypothetical protein